MSDGNLVEGSTWRHREDRTFVWIENVADAFVAYRELSDVGVAWIYSVERFRETYVYHASPWNWTMGHIEREIAKRMPRS